MSGIVNDIIKVFVTNLIGLLIGIGTGFLLPKYLSIEDYSFQKTYMLYLGLVGVLHFGFLDGLYIKYGGKDFKRIDRKTISSEFNFFLLQQLFITTIALIILIIFKLDIIFFLVVISIIPINIFTFFNFLFQSTGKFSHYSIINITRRVLNFLPIPIFFFIIRTYDIIPLLYIQIFSLFLIVGFLYISGFNFLKYFHFKKIFNREKITLASVGFFIMIGNFSAIFFYSIDRWFIKLFYSTSQFAFYSFAIGLLSIVMILITSVSMTFYPHFAKDTKRLNWFKILKKIILITGIVGIGLYFIFDIVVKWYLPAYTKSLDIVMILFIGFPMIGVINSIYINIYKAFKKERVYFLTVIFMLLISIVFNLIALISFHTMEAIAIATTLTFFVWYIFSSFYKKFLRIDIREVLLIAGYIMTFYMSYLVGRFVERNMEMGYIAGSIVGMLVYYSVILVMIHVYDKGFYKMIIKLVNDQLKGIGRTSNQ